MATYFDLPREDRLDVLKAVSPIFGISEELAEKDIWICWALGTLFAMPGALPTAFKGGTSLSKVFNAIQRVSEDIDLSVDIRNLGHLPTELAGMTGSQAKKIREQAEAALKTYTCERVVPWMELQASAQCGNEGVRVDVDEKGEGVMVHYPSAIPGPAGYLRSGILLEFGGRNTTVPSETHRVAPYAKDLGFDLTFPEAEPLVLSPIRTFWEKATLIHLECRKPRERTTGRSLRLSRHWYDMAKLADHEIGRKAVGDRNLAETVVVHKSTFFRDRNAEYTACLSGGLALIPPDYRLEELRADFRQMVDAGMFYGIRPDFGEITDRLSRLQDEINQNMRSTALPPG